MSNIKVQGNVSGTGSLTIAAPNTNTDRTLTLPDESGTVLTSASPVIAQAGVPAFSAYQSVGTAQSISNASFTKVMFQTEEFDTASCYDATTNYRFTPNVAGYYQINSQINFSSMAASGTVFIDIQKNGNTAKRGQRLTPTLNNIAVIVSALVYLNGSTDYVEIYVYQGSGVSQPIESSGSYESYFQGVLVRAA